MRSCIPLVLAMTCVAALAAPACAAMPDLVGTWVAGPDEFVSSGAGSAVKGWNAMNGPKNVITPKPSVVVERQEGRIISGYIVTPTGDHDPFHGMIKASGSGLTARNAQGIIMADLHGNTIDWCWASTGPNLDYVACNQLRRAGK